jgi:hypothetical protein
MLENKQYSEIDRIHFICYFFVKSVEYIVHTHATEIEHGRGGLGQQQELRRQRNCDVQAYRA